MEKNKNHSLISVFKNKGFPTWTNIYKGIFSLKDGEGEGSKKKERKNMK